MTKKGFHGLHAILVAQPTSKCLTLKTLKNTERKKMKIIERRFTFNNASD